jgi:hypothetical protein
MGKWRERVIGLGTEGTDCGGERKNFIYLFIIYFSTKERKNGCMGVAPGRKIPKLPCVITPSKFSMRVYMTEHSKLKRLKKLIGDVF